MSYHFRSSVKVKAWARTSGRASSPSSVFYMSCNLCFFIFSIRVTISAFGVVLRAGWHHGCASLGRLSSTVLLLGICGSLLLSVLACAEHWVGILLSIWKYKKSLNTGTAFYINYHVIIPQLSVVIWVFHSDHLMDSVHSCGGGMLQRRMSVWAEVGLPACGICLATRAAHRDDQGS